jgi:hypothetical protein
MDSRSGRTIYQRCRCHATLHFLTDYGPCRRNGYNPTVVVFDGIEPKFSVALSGNSFDGIDLFLDILTATPASA